MRRRSWNTSSVKGEPMTKIVLIIGIMWAGICLIILWILWINHRFHRHHVSSNDHQKLASQVSDKKTENRKSVTQLTSENAERIIYTNLNLSPKTGKITSPSGEMELESYRRSKAAKTIKKTPSDRDVQEE